MSCRREVMAEKGKISIILFWQVFATVTFSMVGFFAAAESSIAVLDFELRDLTLAPNAPAELKRTVSIKPLLEEKLQRAGFRIVAIGKARQQQADGGVGYLFEHHDAAAALAKNSGADYIVVGRLHKPSFLFAYLMVHLVDVDDGCLIGDYVTESKGNAHKLTLKAVENLVVKIRGTLDRN